MKLRYLFFISLFAVLAGGWAARVQIAGLVIPPVMHSFGLTEVDANVSQLDLNQSQLSHLAFNLTDENTLLQFEAHDINISYTLRQLSEARINSLSIGRLVLHYVNNPHSVDADTAHKAPTHEILQPIKILAALRLGLREYAIFNSVSVQRITLNGETFAALQDKHLRLKLINDQASLYAELSLLDRSASAQQDSLQQLVISRLDQNTLNAELRLSAKTEAVPARLELNFHDTDTADADAFDKAKENKILSGNYHIIPAQLQIWLQAFADLQYIEKVEKIDGTLSISQLAEEHITSTLTAAISHFKYGSYRADDVFLKLKAVFLATDPLSLIKINNGSYLKTSNFTFDDVSLAASPLFFTGELSSTNGNWQYNGGARSETIAITYPPHLVQFKAFSASLSATAKSLNVKGNFSPATVPGKFSFSLAHDLNSGHGQLAIDPAQTINLNAEDSRLSQLVTPWTYPFELLSGHIKLTSQAIWSPEKTFSLTTKIKLEDGGGTLADEIIFSGLSFDHELELLPQLHSIRAGNIDLRHLDSGVTSSNISTGLTLKKAKTGPLPRIVVLDLHGEILGGTFSADDFVFDLNKNKNRFRIKAMNIDLAEVVKTQQLDSIEVSGRVDGTIPVEINEQGLFIEHGALVNTVRAGTIRYNAGAGSDQLRENPLTGIALDALKDFRYSHLSADVNYRPEGALTVNLQLQGTSPELDTDRPVHLNINTEQNLIALLKSLRFAQGISDNIDKNVRLQYEKSRSKI